MRLGKETDDIGGHFRADTVDVEQPRLRLALPIRRRLHLAPPRGERAIVTGEQPCRRLADLGNAERVDEALERNPPALVDRRHQIASAEVAPALALGDHRRVEPEDVAWLADQPILPKRGDVLFTEPVDVEAIARHEMLQPFDGLRRT